MVENQELLRIYEKIAKVEMTFGEFVEWAKNIEIDAWSESAEEAILKERG